MSQTERVLEPSPVHLLRAEQEGIVARSAELSRSLVICIALGGVLLFSGSLLELYGQQIEKHICSVTTSAAKFQDHHLVQTENQMINSIGWFSIGLVAVSLVIWQIQSPLKLKLENALPKLGRLSPIQGWSRVFSFQGFTRTSISLLGATVLFGIWGYYLLYQPRQIVWLMEIDLAFGLQKMMTLFKSIFMMSGAVILLLGLIDYVRERFKVAAQLKQTEQEQREEARQQEMNPEVRRNLLSRQS